MTRIANKYGAINLSQWFSDFDPPAELIEGIKEAADSGPHQYEITWGSIAIIIAAIELIKNFLVPANYQAIESIILIFGISLSFIAALKRKNYIRK